MNEEVKQLMQKGAALMQQGKFEEVLKTVDEAIALEPENANAHLNRAITLDALKRLQDAVYSYEKALKLEPKNADIRIAFGQFLCKHKKPIDALKLIEKGLSEDKENPVLWLFRGNVLDTHLKNPTEALLSLDKAIEYGPAKFIQPAGSKGIILKKLECYEEALATFDKALTEESGNALLLSHKASVLNDLNRTDEAQNILRNVIDQQPKFFPAHVLLGDTLLKSLQPAQALSHYDAAISINATSLDAWLGKAKVLGDKNSPTTYLPEASKGCYARYLFLKAKSNNQEPSPKELHPNLVEAGAPMMAFLSLTQNSLTLEDLAHTELYLQLEAQLSTPLSLFKKLQALGQESVLSLLPILHWFDCPHLLLLQIVPTIVQKPKSAKARFYQLSALNQIIIPGEKDAAVTERDQMLAKSMDLVEELQKDTLSPEERYYIAWLLHLDTEPEDAIELLEAEEQFVPSLLLRAWLLHEIGEEAQALEQAKKVLRAEQHLQQNGENSIFAMRSPETWDNSPEMLLAFAENYAYSQELKNAFVWLLESDSIQQMPEWTALFVSGELTPGSLGQFYSQALVDGHYLGTNATTAANERKAQNDEEVKKLREGMKPALKSMSVSIEEMAEISAEEWCEQLSELIQQATVQPMQLPLVPMVAILKAQDQLTLEDSVDLLLYFRAAQVLVRLKQGQPFHYFGTFAHAATGNLIGGLNGSLAITLLAELLPTLLAKPATAYFAKLFGTDTPPNALPDFAEFRKELTSA